ncbi:MAG: flagellar hook-basal body protein [Firmicutes bacterium]|nr:flagellar hook-basal body protein [Bacillota bacterium]
MLKSIANSTTGLRAHQQMLDVTAHNLANVNTVAYKERLVSFQELLYRDLKERRLPVAGHAVRPPSSGRGVALTATAASSRAGSLHFTGRPFDLALEGAGFFRVTRPDGSHAYTRCGNFFLDAEGGLVTAAGDKLGITLDRPAKNDRDENIDLSALIITPQGEIFIPVPPPQLEKETDARSAAENKKKEEKEEPPAMEKVGELPLYRFANPQGLLPIGGNLFLPADASGQPREGQAGEDGFGLLKRGFLETSNVDLAGQMVNLMRGQRAFQAAARSLTTADELWAQTLNLQV